MNLNEFWKKRAKSYGHPNTTGGLQASNLEANLLEKYIPCGSKVLDYGVGDGRLFAIYENIGCKVTGYDVAEYPELAYSWKAHYMTIEKIHIADSFPAESLSDLSFDVIVAFSVLHHVHPKDIQKLLWQLTRLSELFIFSGYDGKPLPLKDDSYQFSHNWTELFVNSDLRVIHTETVVNTKYWVLTTKL